MNIRMIITKMTMTRSKEQGDIDDSVNQIKVESIKPNVGSIKLG